MRKQTLFYWLLLLTISTSILTGCNDDNRAVSNKQIPAAVTSVSNKTSNALDSTATQAQTGDVRVYTAKGDYPAPGGMEDFTVNISTDKNGVVTDITTNTNSTRDISLQYMDAFLGGIKSEIIGKPLKELSASGRVSGASLTSGGYNKALQQIQDQAKAA